MESLRWIAVVFSMVLGLGVTRLMTGSVVVFKARRTVRIDWLPLVWAICVLLTQLQFWWGLYDIPPSPHGWNFLEFLAVVSLPMTLFLASAVLLPATEAEAIGRDGKSYFELEGRWGLVPYGLYFVLAYLGNVFFFNVPPFSPISAVHLVLAVVPIVVLASTSRRIQIAATLLYIPATCIGIWANSDVY